MGTTETVGAGAEGSDTPSAGNVSDATTQVATPATTNVNNDDSASSTTATRSDDTRGQGFDITKLLDRLDALPESIANAVKEAAPTVQAPATTSDNSSSNAENGTQVTSTAGNGAVTAEETSRTRSEKFASWWFSK